MRFEWRSYNINLFFGEKKDLKKVYLSIIIIKLTLLYRQTYIIRLMPQVTVDNKLGPDRLAGLKALDPNYRRQPTL